MEPLDAAMLSMDALLDFSFDVSDEDYNEEEDGQSTGEKRPSLASKSHRRRAQLRLPAESDSDGDRRRSFPVLHEEDDDEEEEEELEWLLNQDAFPSIETFDILSPEKPSSGGAGGTQKHQSPVSVLEASSSSNSSGNDKNNSSYGFPVRAARSKRRRRGRSSFTSLLLSSGDHQQWWFWFQKLKNNEKKSSGIINSTTATAKLVTTEGGGVRRCKHCLAEKTPQWRAGPMGPKTLCNACGVRYKSGRLVPEYRPASSPSFSGDLHSNSHRKILEMRRTKQKKQVLLQCLGNG